MTRRPFLQGSYSNNTNTKLEPDVDIMVEYIDCFISNIEDLSREETTRYENSRQNADYSWKQFRDEVLKALNNHFPGTDKVYVKQFRMNSATGDYIGQIRAIVNAKKRKHIQDLNQVFIEQGYQIDTNAITTSKDSKYIKTSDIDVGLKEKHRTKPPQNKTTQKK